MQPLSQKPDVLWHFLKMAIDSMTLNWVKSGILMFGIIFIPLCFWGVYIWMIYIVHGYFRLKKQQNPSYFVTDEGREKWKWNFELCLMLWWVEEIFNRKRSSVGGILPTTLSMVFLNSYAFLRQYLGLDTLLDLLLSYNWCLWYRCYLSWKFFANAKNIWSL